MRLKTTPRWWLAAYLLVLSLGFLPGCASLGDAIGDSLPVSSGEVDEAVASLEEAIDGSASGNALAAGGGILGVFGIGMVVARRMIKKALGAYDEAPFQGPGGTTLPEEELVARVQALPSPSLSKSSS